MTKLLYVLTFAIALLLLGVRAEACNPNVLGDISYGDYSSVTISCRAADGFTGYVNVALYYNGVDNQGNPQLYINFTCTGDVSSCGVQDYNGTIWTNSLIGPVGDYNQYFAFAYDSDGSLFGAFAYCQAGSCNRLTAYY